MKYALVKSANRQPTTARKTPSPILAVGISGPTEPEVVDHARLEPRLRHEALLRQPPDYDARYDDQKDQYDAHAVPLCGKPWSRVVLREEILLRAGHAVVIGPAIDDWHFLAPVAVRRRRFRRLPLKRRRAPRIAAGLPAMADAPEQVEQEDHLREADDKGHDA